MSPTFDAKAWLGQITADMREAYARNRRVMSFGEYLTLFEIDMPRQVRSAAQYLRDVFDRYGTTTVRGPAARSPTGSSSTVPGTRAATA